MPCWQVQFAFYEPCCVSRIGSSPDERDVGAQFWAVSRRKFSWELMSVSVKDTFRSLNSFNYRVWSGGALVSNVGTWMQRTAQDWIVLTQLTHHDATAVGVVMALQFGPQVLLLPLTGYAADHFDRRKLVF